MADIAGAVIAGATFLMALCEKLKREDYTSKDPEEIRSDLDDAMGRLSSLVEDRKNKFDWGKGDRKKQTKTYEHWVRRVEKLQSEVKSLKDEDKRKKAKWKIPLSNLVGRMKNLTIKAIDLFMEHLDDLCVPKPPKRVELMTAPSIEEYPTLQNSLQSILDILKDHSKFDCIRVQGEFGVGKTAILKNLNNHKDVAQIFDLVIWVNVSDEENVKNFDISKMQKEIANRLNINMEGEVDFKDRIKLVLKNKRYLLLLNRVSGELNFEDIGIFRHYDYLGSKIVLTSRLNRVCHGMVTESIEVKRLLDPEAQKMFLKFLGEETFLQYMQDVFEYCSRLPYIIEKIACAFNDRKSDERKWQEGLDNLRHYPSNGDGSIMSVSQFIEFCYNELKKEEKDCFLYSALNQGEIDININYLLDCWAAEELYGTTQERALGNNILNKLKMASLIGESECGPREYVRIYKFAWQMARLKLRARDGVLVETGIKDPLDVEDWNQKHQISLFDVELGPLPDCPDAPKLSTLFLERNKSLDTIPTTFFEKMENLRVLNLQHSGIISLPPSLRHLKNVKVFYLNGCTSLLKLPPEIQQMKSLEVLDTRGTGLEIIQDSGEPSCGQYTLLPSIKPLRRLKRLLVSLNASNYQKACQDVSHFCRGISDTSATLEELIIHVNSFQTFCDEMINDVRESVATMRKLRLLKFQFIDGAEEVIVVDIGIRKTFFPEAGNLASYSNEQNSLNPPPIQVYVGCSISSHQIPDIKRYQSYLKICDALGFNLPRIISPVLPSFHAFELINNRDLEHLSMFETAHLTGVKACLIEGCNKLEAIADGQCITDDSPMLPELQELYLKKLQMLKSIWKGPWKAGSLVELKILLIEGCNKLKAIVDDNCIMDDSPMLPELQELYLKKLQLLKSIWKGPWKAGSLVKLETLLIEDCIEIEELHTAGPWTSLNLPNLKKLILTNLPNLKKICANVEDEWLALEVLQMDRCDEIYELPFQGENAKNLKKLVLVNLPSLTISANALVKWPALEELHIDGCEKIFELPIRESSIKGLKKLTLIDLRKLRTLGGFGILPWLALEKLEIRDCPLLTRLPFNNESAWNLKYIIASQTWFDSLQWRKEDDYIKQRLQNCHRIF